MQLNISKGIASEWYTDRPFSVNIHRNFLVSLHQLIPMITCYGHQQRMLKLLPSVPVSSGQTV